MTPSNDSTPPTRGTMRRAFNVGLWTMAKPCVRSQSGTFTLTECETSEPCCHSLRLSYLPFDLALDDPWRHGTQDYNVESLILFPACYGSDESLTQSTAKITHQLVGDIGCHTPRQGDLEVQVLQKSFDCCTGHCT